MKHLFTLIFTLMGLPLGLMAQGWPANYDGVMLQGFYWDSYSDTKWTNLTSQADELSKYFSLIWVPQSGWCKSTTDNMGYYPIYWFDQRSAFGSEDDLRTMISTFKKKGTGIIADVVVNHKNGVSKWCDFAKETVKGKNTGKTYSVTWDNTGYTQICNNDEANTATKSEAKGKIKGAADTGLGDTGCRDLDHTNPTTQQNIKTYEDFLLNEMGYTGFRYDFVKGYDPKYIKMYNEASKPKFSVGEYWHGAVTTASKKDDHPFGGVKDWVEATGKTSAAFDFPMKYLIKSAFDDGNWKLLATNYTTSTLVGIEPQYAVTFIDNHDTGEPHVNPDPLRANVEAANAYTLALPGTPCIWISHWKPYKYTIKKCILARKIAGVTNTSSIIKSEGQDNGYVLIVKGNNGNVMLLLGSPTYSTAGYQLACEGENFKYYVSNGLDISEVNSIKREDTGHVIPSFCKVNEGETCAFFEQPASSDWKGDIYCYTWDNNYEFGGRWPGAACTKVGTTADGKTVWKWTWDNKVILKSGVTGSASYTLPSHIIFTNKKAGSDSGAQTLNMQFKNGNYYGDNVTYGNATGISHIKANAQGGDSWYTMSGTRMASKPTQKGVYIHQGKKAVVK